MVFQGMTYFLLILTFGNFPKSVYTTPTRLELENVYSQVNSSGYTDDVTKAKIFLTDFDREANELQVESGVANWQYETDLTDKHLKQVVEVGEKVSNFYLNSSVKTRSVKSLDLPYNLSRQIRLITRTVSPSEKELRAEITTLIGNMTKIFGASIVKKKDENGTVSNFTNSDLREILSKSQNLTELNWAWKGWRDGVGPSTRPLFSSLVDYLNIGAREHGWLDYGRFLRSEYEMSDMLEESLDEVWERIQPLYKELHAYVRFKLSKKYKIKDDACIPASVLGEMYAQDWEGIFDLVKPNEDSKAFDVTDQLKAQNYTVRKMFELAESFFTSIGLDAMPETFWNRSVLVKPTDKDMVCHASAWDVSREDVRIKMCTHVNQKDLTTIHHEMGHLEYFLAYKNQPTIFRAGANPGFHEAIGDTISLSVETPSYLHKVGLLNTSNMNKDDEISFLLNQALRRIAPIPYNLLVDKWRWRIFEGVITEDVYNKAWWDHRIMYQGVEPPVMRPANAFDAASKYHIGANAPYVPRLCTLAGHTGKLYTCSIFNSTKAGSELRKLLSAGRSQPWPLILQSFSAERTLKADAILEYFAPLNEWLVEKRKKEGYKVGWKKESSVPILQAQPQKLESGQERSSIVKANNNNNNNENKNDKNDGKTTLSFNIPPDALKSLLKNYPEIKQQYEGGKASVSTTQVENATNQTDSKMAAGTIGATKLPSNSAAPQISAATDSLSDNSVTSTNPQETTMNEISKLLAEKAAKTENSGNSSSKHPNISGAALENSPKVADDESSNGENINIPSVDKDALLSTIKNLLQNNVSLTDNQNSPDGLSSKSKQDQSTGNKNLDEGDSNNSKSSEPATNNNKQIALLPISSISPQLLSSLKSYSASNKSSEPIHNSPSLAGPKESQENNQSPALFNEALVNPEGKQGAVTNASKDTSEYKSSDTIIDQASSLSKEELLNVLKDAIVNKQSSSYDHLNLPKNSDNGGTQSNTDSIEKTQEQEKQTKEHSSEIPSNEDITIGLRKLLGMTEKTDKINTTTISPDGSKFTKFVETCVRSSDDPKCLHGKIIKEGAYVPKGKNGVDEIKQTMSISPSTLVQKLMERKKAEESTPDAVVNAIPGSQTEASSEANKQTTSVDPKVLMKLLQNAVNTQSKSNTLSTRQDVANTTDVQANKTLCTKLRKKRGFSIKYNCGGLLSNYTHVGLANKAPVSTTDLLRTLIKNSGGGEISSNNNNVASYTSLPPTRIQKTSNGFQVDFDLHVKDQIPMSGTLKTLSSGRQQHIDFYNTPKGVAVKPKSSVQLLKPQFIPVAQSTDNVELKERRKRNRYKITRK